ncbi:hypothetical protein IB270_29320 [Ensifer sp. ENS05]|uniref:hypothetical protein n=1 Tax=Ensifer sp. ENS05 TaxID=2769277 RepID=UPI00178201CA|nr:hypothetical protein [Ensifer sp. ENS05]MBD9596936.1 hypothetical protein [Ensifer sp. ENS05]
MLLEDWLEELKKILETESFDSSRSRDAKLFLVRLHELMLDAPPEIRTPYGLLKEPDIEKEMLVWDSNLSRAPTKLPIGIMDLSQEQKALVLAGIIRACDLIVAGASRGPTTSVKEWDLGHWWMIHRKQGRITGDVGQPYTRRGLLRHVLLKKAIRGRRVVPTPLSMQIPSKCSTRLAAALFDNLEVVPDQNLYPKHYVAVDLNCPNQVKVVEAQLAQARGEKHFALVWPELTIPPHIQSQIEADLEGAAFKEPGKNPELTVAGSWHLPDEGMPNPVSNISAIYDKYGNCVLQYKKVVPYHDNEGNLHELINSGNEVPVLVSDEYLVSLAICKDLCDLSSDVAYKELNVDYVLVPSMGDENCMQSHRANSKAMRTQRNARPFVVQQTIPADGSGLGKVLPPIPNPMQEGLDLNVVVTFKSYAGHL